MLAGGLPSPMGQLDDEPAQLIPGLEPSVWISNEPFPIKLYKLLESLQSGDRVVVNGLQKILYPGIEVAPQLVAMDRRKPAGNEVAQQTAF